MNLSADLTGIETWSSGGFSLSGANKFPFTNQTLSNFSNCHRDGRFTADIHDQQQSTCVPKPQFSHYEDRSEHDYQDYHGTHARTQPEFLTKCVCMRTTVSVG